MYNLKQFNPPIKETLSCHWCGCTNHAKKDSIYLRIDGIIGCHSCWGIVQRVASYLGIIDDNTEGRKIVQFMKDFMKNRKQLEPEDLEQRFVVNREYGAKVSDFDSGIVVRNPHDRIVHYITKDSRAACRNAPSLTYDKSKYTTRKPEKVTCINCRSTIAFRVETNRYKPKPTPTHLSTKANDGYSECGMVYTTGNCKLTNDTQIVTCHRCRVTKYFRKLEGEFEQMPIIHYNLGEKGSSCGCGSYIYTSKNKDEVTCKRCRTTRHFAGRV